LTILAAAARFAGLAPEGLAKTGMTRFQQGGSRRNWPWSPISIN